MKHFFKKACHKIRSVWKRTEATQKKYKSDIYLDESASSVEQICLASINGCDLDYRFIPSGI